VTSILIPGSDFTLPPPPKRQAVALLFGQPGHGKTTLGVDGAPDPIAFIDIDRRGFHACAAATAKGKRILYVDIDYPKDVTKLDVNMAKAAAQKQWDKFYKNHEIAVRESEKGDVRTIVWDTATEIAEIANLVVVGRPDRAKDDYGKSAAVVKAMLTRTIKMTREGNANLIMLARAKEIWEGGQPTGRFTYRGPDTLEFDADWAGHIRLSPQKTARQKPSQDHELEVTKAGIDLRQLGEVYREDDWEELGPFVYACVMNYPGSRVRDWK
jgi:hypothetical protein